MAAGLAVIVGTGLLGSLSRSHFDGVLDFHTGAEAPPWLFVFEGPIDWLALAVPLWIGGLLISKSRPRAIDVLGTQALARFPTLALALVGLLPGKRYALYLQAKFLRVGPPSHTGLLLWRPILDYVMQRSIIAEC